MLPRFFAMYPLLSSLLRSEAHAVRQTAVLHRYFVLFVCEVPDAVFA